MEFLAIATLAVVVLLLIALARMRSTLARRETELAAARQEHGQASDDRKKWVDALTAATSLGFVVLNSQGRVIFINRAARAIFAVEDGIGRPLEEIAWGYDLQPSVDYVLKQRNELVHQTIVRDEHFYAATLQAVGGQAEEGVVIELNEVTELQRLGRARREFVANISHELRTPITSLQLLMETMNENRLTDREFALEFLGKMRIQIDLLRQLTDELMDLALIESGQAPIKLIETSAVDLANQVAEALRPQAERKGLALDVTVPTSLRVLADPQAIQKVLGNLVHNAIKFTLPGGRIEIRAATRADNVEFAVEDTGIGIPSDDLPRIFERFYKVDRSRPRADGELHGTGLAIAKHVVSAHGGNIWATSVEGSGSTFYFTVPEAC